MSKLIFKFVDSGSDDDFSDSIDHLLPAIGTVYYISRTNKSRVVSIESGMVVLLTDDEDFIRVPLDVWWSKTDAFKIEHYMIGGLEYGTGE